MWYICIGTLGQNIIGLLFMLLLNMLSYSKFEKYVLIKLFNMLKMWTNKRSEGLNLTNKRYEGLNQDDHLLSRSLKSLTMLMTILFFENFDFKNNIRQMLDKFWYTNN